MGLKDNVSLTLGHVGMDVTPNLCQAISHYYKYLTFLGFFYFRRALRWDNKKNLER